VDMATFRDTAFSERSEILQGAADRAAIRLEYCRREYERAVTTLDPTNPQHARVLSKLAEDQHRAETDAGWTQRRLDEAHEKGSAAFRRA
jgi:hypothetical protein